MNYKLLFDTAVLAGDLLICNGAETYRVEDTMNRILQKSHLETAQVLVLMTGFIATLDDPSIDILTAVHRITYRGTDLEIIDRVNLISRAFCQDRITLEDAWQQMNELKKPKEPRKDHDFVMIAIVAGFAVMLGGTPMEALIASATGLTSALILKLCRKCKLHMFLEKLLCCVGIAVLVGLVDRAFPGSYNKDLMIISSIMPFVPGAAITNSVFDTLHGDYLSGAARMAEAFAIASAVAIGIGLGLILV